MASNYAKLMASATKHAVAGSTRLLATNYGKHIFSVKITEDMDNGCIIGVGDFHAMEYYDQAAAGTFTGKIVGQASNGNYYVEVATVDDSTVLVLTTPLLYEEWTKELQEEWQFFNANGDIVRAYGLAPHDVFELSAEGFDGDPVVGRGVTVNASTHKLTVAAAANNG